MGELISLQVAGRALDVECPEGVHPPGESSRRLADLVAATPGASLLDLGCGTGIVAIAAAGHGAREVWATDIDARACEAARRNAGRNGVRVRVAQGDLFEPVAGRRFEVIVTNPPQTPAPGEARGPKFGGEDGLRYFEPILERAPAHLAPGGRLVTMIVSLADTKRFVELLSRAFESSLLGEQERAFTRQEYDAYWPGLFDFLRERRRRGLAEFEEDGEAGVFKVRFYSAWLR